LSVVATAWSSCHFSYSSAFISAKRGSKDKNGLDATPAGIRSVTAFFQIHDFIAAVDCTGVKSATGEFDGGDGGDWELFQYKVK